VVEKFLRLGAEKDVQTKTRCPSLANLLLTASARTGLSDLFDRRPLTITGRMTAAHKAAIASNAISLYISSPSEGYKA
jgi:hypothetical protein